MQSNGEEILRNPKDKKRLFYVAFGAIFLLVMMGAAGKFSSDSLHGQANVLLASSYVSMDSSSALSQLSSDAIAVPEAPELVFVDESSILAIVPPVTVTPKILGAIIGGVDADFHTQKEVLHYIVEEEDTLSSLAEEFDISTDTIRWANDLSRGASLAAGQSLIILPVSGTLHLVRPHDTLSEITFWYKADSEEIVEFNNLESTQEIFAGDLLVVPHGIMPKTLPQGRLTPLANSYFIYPVPRSHRITQELHPYNAVDLSNGKCSQPIYAAAGGTIQKATYSSTAGNYVRILHPNGVVTFYAHLSTFAVSPGDRTLQGQIIGYTGHSGYTIPSGPSGCHLHFEVRGAVNPFR